MMAAFSFLLRVGFLLNLLFLICLAMRFVPAPAESSVISFLLMAGLLLSYLVNLIVALWWLVAVRKFSADWKGFRTIFIINMLVFLFQVLIYFF